MQLLRFLNPRLLDLRLEDAVLDEFVHKKPHGLPSSLAFLFRARDEACPFGKDQAVLEAQALIRAAALPFANVRSPVDPVGHQQQLFDTQQLPVDSLRHIESNC